MNPYDSQDSPAESGGYFYFVTDEQLEAFADLNPLQRLRWLDEARRFTLMAETQESAYRRERIRRGERVG